MAERPDTYWYIFDRTIYDQIELPAFEWWETFLLIGVVALGALYLFVVWYLDRRNRRRARFARTLEWLEPRLQAAGLDPEEWAALHRLAGTGRESRLYAFLADPVAFETRVHEALRHGRPLPFAGRLREALGYHSDNLLVPMVSTRQMRPGDGVRITEAGAMPRHHYGRVESVDAATFTVALGGEAGLDPARLASRALSLHYVRGQDLEYPLPLHPAAPLRDPRRLELRHALLPRGAAPRQTRLPLMAEVRFSERVLHPARPADALEPGRAGGGEETGVLHDLHDSGFSLVTRREVAAGRMLEFVLPLRRSKRRLTLMGRVTRSRPLGADRSGAHHWMVHATLRGLDRQRRQALHQIVMQEQQRRFRRLAHIRLRPRHAPQPPPAAREDDSPGSSAEPR